MFPLKHLFRRRPQHARKPLMLSDVATHITTLETAPSYPAALLKNGSLNDTTHSLFQGWASSPCTLHQYTLENVVLDTASMIFFQDGHPIMDTAYLQPPDVIPALAIREDTLIPAPPEQKIMAACFDHWHQNYYHWIAHTIPTLYHLKNNTYNGGLILPLLTHWQEESIRLLGFNPSNSTRTEPGKQYAFRKVLYTDCVKGAADFSVLTSSRQAYHTLAQSPHIPTRATPPLNIFIERGQSPNRFMSNESELSQALTHIGFTAVKPETLSITEQIRLFSQARIVMGSLGAGMANLAWCKPGTIICELVPQQHPNPCTLALAMQMQLQYWGEPIETGVDIASHITPAYKTFNVSKIVQRAKDIIQYTESIE